MSNGIGGGTGLANAGDQNPRMATGKAALALLVWPSLVALLLNFMPSPYNEIVLYPIRLFVTMIHESGHALATVISGGQVSYLQIHSNGEGVTWSMTPAWAQWLVISGGYMGTTLFGALLLQLVRFSGHKITLNLVGAYILVVTLLWAHSPVDFAFTFPVGIVLAAIFFVAARYLSATASAYLVSFLAIQCCLNAIGDLRILLYLTTAAPGTDNDAVFMSQHYPFPPTFWAGLWALSAIAILSLSLWRYVRASSSSGKRYFGRASSVQ